MATHLTITQGTPFQFLVTVQRRNLMEELVPMELTGAFVQLQARSHVRARNILLDLSSENGGIDIEEEKGRFTVQMSSEETSALVWGNPHISARAVYQCEIEPIDGETIRILEGTLTLDPEVVR